MDGEIVGLIVVSIFLLGLGIMIGGLIQEGRVDIELSQETADKICLDITGEEGVVAKDWLDFSGNINKPIERGELYCQIPSYDSTHLIKVGD